MLNLTSIPSRRQLRSDDVATRCRAEHRDALCVSRRQFSERSMQPAGRFVKSSCVIAMQRP